MLLVLFQPPRHSCSLVCCACVFLLVSTLLLWRARVVVAYLDQTCSNRVVNAAVTVCQVLF